MSTQTEISKAAKDLAEAERDAARAERVQVVRLVPGLAGRGCSASDDWNKAQAKLNKSDAKLKKAKDDLAAEVAVNP